MTSGFIDEVNLTFKDYIISRLFKICQNVEKFNCLIHILNKYQNPQNDSTK